MRFNEPASSGSIPLEGAWETSGIRFCSSNQDAGIPCVFQVLRPISVHTYPCQPPPPALCEAQQAELKEAVQELPEAAGIGLANWTLRQAQEEGRSPVCLGEIRPQPEPQQLSELPAPAGVCLQAAQEAAAQGGRGQTGGLRGGVRHPVGRGGTDWRQDILCRRGPLPGGRRTAGQVGAERDPGSGGLDQPAVWGEGQLLFGGLLGDGRGGVAGTEG